MLILISKAVFWILVTLEISSEVIVKELPSLHLRYPEAMSFHEKPRCLELINGRLHLTDSNFVNTNILSHFFPPPQFTKEKYECGGNTTLKALALTTQYC